MCHGCLLFPHLGCLGRGDNYSDSGGPTQSEKEEILTDLLTFNTESTKSYEDFLDEIFNELKINEKEEREQLIKGIQAFNIPQFDKEKTVQFIRINRDFTQNG